MIACTDLLTAAWLAPAELLMDHRAHGTPLDVDHIQRLVERLHREPERTTDPIVVERRADGRLWVTNGRHRVLAHLLAGRAIIAAVIVGE